MRIVFLCPIQEKMVAQKLLKLQKLIMELGQSLKAKVPLIKMAL